MMETNEDRAARERLFDEIERRFYKREGRRLFGKRSPPPRERNQ